MNLCIIIVGLIRTFFDKGYDSLKKILNLSLNIYKKIHIICIISGEYNKNLVLDFIIQMKMLNISIEQYDFNINETQDAYNLKINNDFFLLKKNEYLNKNNYAIKEINNPEIFIKNGACQFYQLSMGIEKMKNYEINNNIVFNVCMKTRFDINYPNNFYPFIHNNDASILDKIYFNKENKFFFDNIINDIDTLIRFLKNEKIKLPECRTPYFKYSFGGSYLNNYISLENIKNGFNNILYMYNDHIIFGSREQFIKLSYLYDNYGIMDTSLNINHYYAQEAQLLIFCFNYNINPIMYLHDCYSIIR